MTATQFTQYYLTDTAEANVPNIIHQDFCQFKKNSTTTSIF